MVFFSTDWVKIGSKSSLCSILPEITGIDAGVLTGANHLESISVAKRMSWASGRITTRVEDMVYYLMGLFDVSMRMLYGEGKKAFVRLQEEIMRHSDDHSLFAWTAPSTHQYSYHGLLAESPDYFACSGEIVPCRDGEPSTPFSLSNKGLCIDLYLSHHEGDMSVAALLCPAPPDYEGYLGIYLKRISSKDHQYARVQPQTLSKLSFRGSTRTIYLQY
jgi:hypothetical protein